MPAAVPPARVPRRLCEVEICATGSGALSADSKHPGTITPLSFVTRKQHTSYVLLIAVR
jgi:hypothetical protein